MGWQVSVNWVAIPIAQCGEIGCDWAGTLGVSEIQAQREADDHWRFHADKYEREQEALDEAAQD